MPTVKPFHGNINFNAHHSPMGAYFSFTCGHAGTRGGLGLQLGQPANQDLYIGVKDGPRLHRAPLRVLPFYEGATKPEADAYLAAAPSAAAKSLLTPIPFQEIQREYGYATDTWRTGDLKFTLCSPFGPIPDPARNGARDMRRALLPAVVAELRIDNRAGKAPQTGFFALAFHERGARVLDTGLRHGSGSTELAEVWPRVGFAWRNELGVAAELYDTTTDEYRPADEPPAAFLRWSVEEGLLDPHNSVHHLASCPGIAFEVPPGKCYSLDLALGAFLAGTVTTRLEGRYLYTRYFASLEDVLDEALTRGHELWRAAAALDQRLVNSGLSPDQQFLVAHAVRSYYGSTQLLDVGGEPFWIVNEGEYCMMNTLDLSIDHMFWELRHNPWLVRNLLDNFVRHYSYHDQVKDPTSGDVYAGGLSFCHDMGINGNFSPPGHSSYELPNLTGCFSYMTQEQLCNWILLAASYVARTGDAAWAQHHAPIIHACFESMLNRDNPLAGSVEQQNGVMAFDSTRCGTGQEITTYDSLDASLGQARRNLYLAVKCWAAYLGLAQLFEFLPDPVIYPHEEQLNSTTSSALDAAAKVATTVANHMQQSGWIPAVFQEQGPAAEARILAAVEGLVYPEYWSTCAHALRGEGPTAHGTEGWLNPAGPFNNLLAALRQHLTTLLSDPEGRNRFPDGGLRLSSTSDNSWMSKIALVQHVCRRVFQLDEHGRSLLKNHRKAGGFAHADAAHVQWQTAGASAYWACSDQIVNGVAQGSKYYPRIITTALWLEE